MSYYRCIVVRRTPVAVAAAAAAKRRFLLLCPVTSARRPGGICSLFFSIHNALAELVTTGPAPPRTYSSGQYISSSIRTYRPDVRSIKRLLTETPKTVCSVKLFSSPRENIICAPLRLLLARIPTH